MDLPDLTPKQLAFFEACQAGMSDREAYKAAYDAENMSEDNIRIEAYRLKNNPNIAPWFEHAKQEAMKRAMKSKDEYLQETERLKGVCEKEKNYGAAVKAHELAGKVMGHYEDRGKGLRETLVLADVLARIQTRRPELAATLASSLGVELSDNDTKAGVGEVSH